MSINSIAYNRHLSILDVLQERGRVRVDELADMLNVSPVTIRRDLDYLNENGFLIRTHGGAGRIKHRQTLQSESEFTEKGEENVDEKARIAEKATEFIEPNDILFLNSGSTALFFLRALRDKRVRVITNNAAATDCSLALTVELLVLGGEYRERSKSFVGEFALNALKNIYSTHTILGTNGISVDQGLTTTVYQECNINQAMIENTHGSVIVLADHTKLGVVSNFVSASIDAVDILVTDDQCPPEFAQSLEDRGIKVIKT